MTNVYMFWFWKDCFRDNCRGEQEPDDCCKEKANPKEEFIVEVMRWCELYGRS